MSLPLKPTPSDASPPRAAPSSGPGSVRSARSARGSAVAAAPRLAAAGHSHSLDLARHTSPVSVRSARSRRSLHSLDLTRVRSLAEERAAARAGHLVRRSSITGHAGVLGDADAAPSATHPYGTVLEHSHQHLRDPHRDSGDDAAAEEGIPESSGTKPEVTHVEHQPGTPSDDGKGDPDDLIAVQVNDKGEEIVYPDGGLQAWLVVLGGFCASIPGFGLTASVGAFQSYYEQELLKTYSSSQISWIGSVMAAMCFGGSCFTGPLVDRFGCKKLLAAGTLLLVLGCIFLSLSKEYYQVFLSQSVVMALGMNLLFISPMGVLGQWFFLRRGLAFGIIMAGSSVGAMIWPIIMANMPSKIGFPWTMRMIALLVLTLGAASVLLMKPRLPPRPPGPYFHWVEFKNPTYAFVACANPFYVFHYFSFLTFIGTYGRLVGLGSLAPYLLTIVNGCSGIGRLSGGFIADEIGSFNTVVICMGIQNVLTFVWLGMKTAPALIAFCAVFGIISGAPISLQGPLITGTVSDPRLAGTVMGQAMLLQAVAQIIGPPILGAILGRGDPQSMLSKFPAAIGLSGSMLFISVMGMLGARLTRSRKLKAVV